MPISWGSGARAEAHSESEEYDLFKEPTADVKLRVGWSARHALASGITGMQWPYNTSVPMYCVNVKITPVPQSLCLSDGGGGNVYPEAFVEAHFDPFTTLTEKLKTNGEMIKIPRFAVVLKDDTTDESTTMLLAWKGDDAELNEYYLSTTLEEAPTKIVVGLDYEVTFNNLDELPEEVISLTDCVNDDTVTPINFSGITFEAETLLLMSTDATHTVDVAGNVKNTLTLKFGWRKNGWNRFWRPTTQSWEPLYVIPVKDSDLPIGDAVGGYDADPDGPTPVIYNNFIPTDFSALLPGS